MSKTKRLERGLSEMGPTGIPRYLRLPNRASCLVLSPTGWVVRSGEEMPMTATCEHRRQFTREDVEMLRFLVDEAEYADRSGGQCCVDGDAARSLADRIEALLPPEDT